MIIVFDVSIVFLIKKLMPELLAYTFLSKFYLPMWFKFFESMRFAAQGQCPFSEAKALSGKQRQLQYFEK